MKSIKGILFDIGGVLYVSNRPIDGAEEMIVGIRQHLPLRFVTNSTRKTPASILKKMKNMGFSLKKEELFTALDATKAYIQRENAVAYTLLTDEAEEWFSDLQGEDPTYVVVGDAHTNFDYQRLNGAFRALMQGATLIAAAKNRYFQDDDEILSMDAGGFIAALEYASNTKAKLIGKPNKEFFLLAVTSMQLEPSEVLMVGDDIESDIKGAKEAGLRTALVQTGKFQPSDLGKGLFLM